MRFRDRTDAGRQLAAELVRHRYDRPVVLALPRGGVPVGAEVAARLGAPLDVLVVRKLGCPGQPEFGIGAITEGGVRVLNRRAITALGITGAQLDAVAAAEGAEVERRVARYRRQRPATPVRGRTAIVVDDGLATGFTARAAITTLRARGPRRIVLAVPVGPSDTVMELRELADEVVCLHTPDVFLALGQWYDDFAQVGDTEVADLLDSAAPTSDDRNGRPGSLVHDVRIPAGSERLPGTLTVPASPVGSVIFAHGSGSSRLSPRNLAVGCGRSRPLACYRSATSVRAPVPRPRCVPPPDSATRSQRSFRGEGGRTSPRATWTRSRLPRCSWSGGVTPRSST